jgi:hypothetical protein
LVFLFTAGNYGACALLIREAAVRWDKRWAGVLLLGAAFGVESEGLQAKTLIDPTGAFLHGSVYSYWLGVNWVPFVDLTLFHAVFSMAVPILLVELLYPGIRGKSLLGGAGLAIALPVLALDSLFLIFVAGPHYFPLLPLVFIAGVAGAYVVAAYLIPKNLIASTLAKPDRPERFFVGLGVGFFAGFFLLSWFGPRLSAPLTLCLFVGLAAVCLHLWVRHVGVARNEVAKTDLMLGLMCVIVPMDVSLEIGGDVGVLVLTSFAVGLLLYLRRKWLREGERPGVPNPSQATLASTGPQESPRTKTDS